MSFIRAKGLPKETLSALIKRGWNTIPDVVGGTVVCFLGLGMVGYANYLYKQKEGDNRRYKLDYVVMRPTDPKAAKVHKD